jgi:Kef-type K+ transport system membrane component KefB
MDTTLLFGLILFTGFIGGELAKLAKLPKVTGYIVAGIFLNPGLFGIIPVEFNDNTDVLTNVALSFITFSVGGSLLFSKIKKMGKGILYITLLEAELAFLFTIGGLLLFFYFFNPFSTFSMYGLFLPAALLLGALASPTDPSATMAVQIEYKAKGPVMSTIMGVAAFDDVFGIVNYSLATAVAVALISREPVTFSAVATPFISIVGAIALGIAFGLLLNFITKLVKKEEDSVLLVILSGILLLTFGMADFLKVDELLATMTVGVVVVNFNSRQETIFKVLERYTDEIIFTLFFTISGLKLNFESLSSGYWLVAAFIVFRFSGKALGAYTGGVLAHSSKEVRKYVAGGLLPQGGIVIGLALMMTQNPAFSEFSDFILNIVLGATIIHELFGPVAAKISLRKAGEIES